MKKSHARRRAFTIIEIIVTLVIITVAVSGFVYVAAAIRDYSTTATMRTSEDAEMLARQSQVAEGGMTPGMSNIDPLLGKGKRTQYVGSNATANVAKVGVATPSAAGGSGVSGSNLWTQFSVVNLGGTATNFKDVQGLGAAYTIGVKVGGTLPSGGLKPPTFNYGGNNSVYAIPQNFVWPMANVMLATPDNPPGTSYHYTIGGPPTDTPNPTKDSPQWTNETYMDRTLPRYIRAVAYYDGKYSAIVWKEFQFSGAAPYWQIRLDKTQEAQILSGQKSIPYVNYAALTYQFKWMFGVNSDGYERITDQHGKEPEKATEPISDPDWDEKTAALIGHTMHSPDDAKNLKGVVISPVVTPKNSAFITTNSSQTAQPFFINEQTAATTGADEE